MKLVDVVDCVSSLLRAAGGVSERYPTDKSTLLTMTMTRRLSLCGLALATFVTLVAAIDRARSPELIARLAAAASRLDRQALPKSGKD